MGHGGITSRYRTLSDREDGKALLDSELGAASAAAMEDKSKDDVIDSTNGVLEMGLKGRIEDRKGLGGS